MVYFAVALNYGVFRRKQFNNTMAYIMFYDMGATSTTATIVGKSVITKNTENSQQIYILTSNYDEKKVFW